jgi:hypothetical protein|tara:strand:- start:1508 stop:1912 length:405 start_codon:yes stop_codon:yes gene_type:complete
MPMTRTGSMGAVEVLTGNIEFFTLFTSLDISVTGDYADATQKDFESVVQVIGLRAMPTVMNNPVFLNGAGANLLENYGAPSMTGAGYIFKFATEQPGAHTPATLIDELDLVVLNAGTINTKTGINMEFTKQDLL